MNRISSKDVLVLGIAPSTRGFGYAVLEGDQLVDWGVKSVQADKNAQSLKKVKELMLFYQPEVMVLEATSAPVRRARRIRDLGKQITALARNASTKVIVLARKQIREAFFANESGTKHAIAEIISKRFPDELGLRLPPRRRPWTSEDHRMGIFDAVALVMTFRMKRRGQVTR